MTAEPLRRLEDDLVDVLARVPRRAVACSGGVDSLLLATVAHRADPAGTLVVHSVTPAVPAAATARVLEAAAAQGWALRTVRSSEFDDPRYLANPRNRCYVCKSHLYDAMSDLVAAVGGTHVLLSGANTDDLGEYRPGLVAAAEHGVRHPYVEAGIGKAGIRALAASLGLGWADLPASPCLASRLYTGTAVTPVRLRAVEVGEELVTRLTGIRVVRCRLLGDAVRIEVADADRDRMDGAVVAAVLRAMRAVDPSIAGAALDDEAYRPGRALELTPVAR
ncbi:MULTISPECIES: ATPase [unclassified Blastococcus]